eukprot:CCRYP_002525-RA/>CCRYP_002525-RA protein AED:0.45 eAED:0.45 QI:0/-1/0/1/-1/1/1/0/163
MTPEEITTARHGGDNAFNPSQANPATTTSPSFATPSIPSSSTSRTMRMARTTSLASSSPPLRTQPHGAHNSRPRNAHLLIPSSTMQQLQLSVRAERPNMPSWSVTLPRTKRLNEQQRNSSATPSTKSGIVTSATIDPSTHTSRQNNSSHTSTTTVGASTPVSS